MKRLGRRLAAAYRKAAALEPARLDAIKTALLAVLTAAGLVITPVLEARIGAYFAAAAAVLALLQGERTRAKVRPETKYQAMVRGRDDPTTVNLGTHRRRRRQ